MKNLLRSLTISLAVTTALCTVAAAVTLYAPDGRTLEKEENEVEIYKSLGWYEVPVTKMYSLDGRSIVCPTENVEANKTVGWYTEPVTKMFAPDGRTLICHTANVEANKKVGWYEKPVTKMYSPDGRSIVCLTENVEANKKVGWYTEPMAIMYAPDGRTLICKAAHVEIHKNAGWYEEPVTTMYSADGRTLVCPEKNVEANKKVGWYTEPYKVNFKITAAETFSKRPADCTYQSKYFLNWTNKISYPKIVSDKSGAKAFNKMLKDEYGAMIASIKNGSDKVSLVNISYTYLVYDNILCVIMSGTVGSQYSATEDFCKVYYYDGIKDKTLSTEEYAKKYAFLPIALANTADIANKWSQKGTYEVVGAVVSDKNITLYIYVYTNQTEVYKCEFAKDTHNLISTTKA